MKPGMHDAALHAEIRGADLIFGADPATGEKSGPYYGIAALKRIVRRNVAEELTVVTIPVDPAMDDVEVLCGIVQATKGAHCYEAFTKKEN
jgi:hypothetical protein